MFLFLIDHLAEKYVDKPFKKAISGELQWFHPLHFMLQSIHINLMLSLGCSFYGPMWTLCTALHSWGDVSQKAKSHGAQQDDGGKQLIECILEAYISLYPVSSQSLVNNYHTIA